jgi:hypothetical protein
LPKETSVRYQDVAVGIESKELAEDLVGNDGGGESVSFPLGERPPLLDGQSESGAGGTEGG